MRKFSRPGVIGGLILAITLLGAGLVQTEGAPGTAHFSGAQPSSQELSSQGDCPVPLLIMAQKAATQEPKQPPEQIKGKPCEPTAPKSMPKSMQPESMERQMERRAPAAVGEVPAKPGTRKFGAQPIRSKETPGE